MIVILILSVLVILHELGHFFMALWLKIRVEEFGLGYPPKARRLFTWRGTDFTLNWIPFGGFVRLWGEELPVVDDQNFESQTTSNSSQSDTTQLDTVEAFYNRPIWHRFLVMLAGPAVNALVAFLLFATIFSLDGIPVSLEGKARIGQVLENTPAAQANMPVHYQIIGFAPAGTSPEQLPEVVTKADQIPAVQDFVANHRGETWQIVLEGPCQFTECGQDHRVVELRLRLPEQTPPDEGAIGVRFAEYEARFYPWYEMPWRGAWFGAQQAIGMSQMMITELIQLVGNIVKGKGVSSALAGPIGIVHQAEKSGLSQAGWQAILSFAGMLSLNLAIMNLLPIPALDGGRIMMLFLEKLLGKSRVAHFEGYVNSAGFLLLVGLLILISIRDVQHIFSK